MIEIDVDVDVFTEPRVTAMASGFVVNLDNGSQRIVLRLHTSTADDLHARLATALDKDCKPRTTAQLLAG